MSTEQKAETNAENKLKFVRFGEPLPKEIENFLTQYLATTHRSSKR